ncbi:MAG TPA: hypothetical protein VGS22_20895 [Thermoanaerobaculia bacterium]|jgi:hypothetical protein|nr:hypothetical protein [Thermoanaerobaculia bacterium]
MFKRIDAISAWSIPVIGSVHIGGLFVYFTYLIPPGSVGVAREYALWWVAGGVTLWLGGALNVLRFHYGERAPMIVTAALGANAAMVLYEIWLAANNPDFVLPLRTLLLALQVVSTLFTLVAWRSVRKRKLADPPREEAALRNGAGLFFAWLTLIAGAFHALAVFHFFQPLVQPGSTGPAREPALWWVSGCVGFCLAALLDLLRLRLGRRIVPLAWTSLIATILMFYYLLLVMTADLWYFLIVRVPLLIGLGGAMIHALRTRPRAV